MEKEESEIRVGKGLVIRDFWDWDWCHMCGERRQEWWICTPRNAKHDKALKQAPRGPWGVRICKHCIAGIAKAAGVLVIDEPAR